MSFKTTGIMAIILVLLGAYYYFFEVVQHEKKEQQKQAAQKLFDFEKDSVETFRVKNQYGEFEFQRIQGEWRITQPVYTSAEENMVNSAINNLVGANKEREFSIQPTARSDYGLGDESISVWFTLRNGSVDSLALGDKTPVGSAVFVAKNDTIVYTIPQHIKTSLDKKLFDWRNKNLLVFDRNEVQRIVIHRQGEEIELEKISGSDWLFKTVDRLANNSTISTLLSRLQNNRAKAFVDEEGTELRKYGLQNPAYQIDLFLGQDKGKRSLIISRKIDGKYYAKDDSRKPIFEIDSTLVKDVKRPRSDFRDKTLAKFDQNSIEKIVIQYGDTLLTCVKDTADQWRLDEPGQPKLKNGNLRSFLSNLRNTTVDEFVVDGQFNPGRYGLDKPSLAIELYQGGAKVVEVKFGTEKDNRVYATTDQYPSVYLLPRAQYTRLKLEQEEILEEPVASGDTTMSPGE